MKNDNTKEKRMQTLPLLYYINKTLFYKPFSIKKLVSNCCMRLEKNELYIKPLVSISSFSYIFTNLTDFSTYIIYIRF